MDRDLFDIFIGFGGIFVTVLSIYLAVRSLSHEKIQKKRRMKILIHAYKNAFGNKNDKEFNEFIISLITNETINSDLVVEWREILKFSCQHKLTFKSANSFYSEISDFLINAYKYNIIMKALYCEVIRSEIEKIKPDKIKNISHLFFSQNEIDLDFLTKLYNRMLEEKNDENYFSNILTKSYTLSEIINTDNYKKRNYLISLALINIKNNNFTITIPSDPFVAIDRRGRDIFEWPENFCDVEKFKNNSDEKYFMRYSAGGCVASLKTLKSKEKSNLKNLKEYSIFPEEEYIEHYIVCQRDSSASIYPNQLTAASGLSYFSEDWLEPRLITADEFVEEIRITTRDSNYWLLPTFSGLNENLIKKLNNRVIESAKMHRDNLTNNSCSKSISEDIACFNKKIPNGNIYCKTEINGNGNNKLSIEHKNIKYNIDNIFLANDHEKGVIDIMCHVIMEIPLHIDDISINDGESFYDETKKINILLNRNLYLFAENEIKSIIKGDNTELESYRFYGRDNSGIWHDGCIATISSLPLLTPPLEQTLEFIFATKSSPDFKKNVNITHIKCVAPFGALCH